MGVISLKNINKSYGKGSSEVKALRGVSLEVNKGEIIAVMGPSGCGKSTLLNIIGCIDVHDSGEYVLDGQVIEAKNINKLSTQRNEKLAFVFQNFALIKELSVLDNVTMPLNYRKGCKNKKEIALKYIKYLGIEELVKKKVSNLSGGQQQRVAIARALTQESEVILADEPTGALDQKNGENIMELLLRLRDEYKKTIIVVTHDKSVADKCDKIIYMKDGMIEV